MESRIDFILSVADRLMPDWRNRSRNEYLVFCRYLIARQLSGLGLSDKRIAGIMGYDRSAVIHLLRYYNPLKGHDGLEAAFVSEFSKVEVSVEVATGWLRALNAARFTVGKAPLNQEPSSGIKRKLLIAEHSPIRMVEYDIKIDGVPMWVTTHLVRHHIGCEKFVRTQRSDRNDGVVDRNFLSQGSLNSMLFTANAQALINISKERLCYKASRETRKVWEAVKEKVGEVDIEMGSVMVRKCVYRGFCPEMDCCGFVSTEKFEKERELYMNQNR